MIILKLPNHIIVNKNATREELTKMIIFKSPAQVMYDHITTRGDEQAKKENELLELEIEIKREQLRQLQAQSQNNKYPEGF